MGNTGQRHGVKGMIFFYKGGKKKVDTFFKNFNISNTGTFFRV